MKRFRLAVLPGDGIGPEVTAEAVRVLSAVGELFGYRLETSEHAIGANAFARFGERKPGCWRFGSCSGCMPTSGR